MTIATTNESDQVGVEINGSRLSNKTSSIASTTLNMKQLRKDSLANESFYARIKRLNRYCYECFINSKFPTVLCIIFYLFICVTGNFITGIIWLKHHNSPIDTYNETNEKVGDFGDLTLIHLNETMLHATLEEEIREREYLGIFHVLKNLTTNETFQNHEPDPTCYEPLEDKLRTNVKFWVEGVAILAIAPCGLLLNLMSVFVFRRSRGNKGFHSLLIMLAVVDSLLLIDMLIQKTTIPYFTNISPMEPDWYKISYPYFWHPWKGIIVTVTIYLLVAISAERYRAVCHPLSRRHSPSKYIIFVIATSLIMKLPRFFHLKMIRINGTIEYWTTPIMDDPVYIRFSSYWDDLFATGALPLAISIFLNLRIYLKIRTSANMECERFVGTGIPSNAEGQKNKKGFIRAKCKTKFSITRNFSKKFSKQLTVLQNEEVITLLDVSKSKFNVDGKDVINDISNNQEKSASAAQINGEFENEKGHSYEFAGTEKNQNEDGPSCQLEGNGKSNFQHIKQRDGEIPPFNSSGISELELHNSLNHSIQSNFEDIKEKPEGNLNDEIRLLRKVIHYNSKNSKFRPCNPSPALLQQNSDKTKATKRCSLKDKRVHRRTKSGETRNKDLSSNPKQQQLSRLKVRTEKSAITLGLIVVLFIFTHCYRMAMKIYEVALPSLNTTEHFKVCFVLRRHHIPIKFYLLFHLNNLVLVINSSINFIICYFGGKDFRKQTKLLLQEIKETTFPCLNKYFSRN